MHSCIKFVGTIYEEHKSDLSGQQIGMAAALVTTWWLQHTSLCEEYGLQYQNMILVVIKVQVSAQSCPSEYKLSVPAAKDLIGFLLKISCYRNMCLLVSKI